MVKRILIVEDTEKHMEDALRIAKELGFETESAKTAEEAKEIIKKGDVDAVVTDIFLPLSNYSNWNHSESPCGINVALDAKETGLPCIFCTDMGHHGSKLQWLYSIIDKLGLPEMVDAIPEDYYYGTASTKKWKEAIQKVTGTFVVHGSSFGKPDV